MSEPVTPKAKRRVIDGEVVDDKAEKSASSEDAQQDVNKAAAGNNNANARRRAHNQKKAEKRASADVNKPTKKPSFLVAPWFKQTALWGGALVVVAGTLLYTRPNMDWQIEHINRLQAQVAQLHQTNSQLVDKVEAQQSGLDARIAKVLSQSEHLSSGNQTDLEAVKTEVSADAQQQMASLYQQVQTDLTAFNRQIDEKMAEIAERSASADTPNGADLTAFNEFQQSVEVQLKQIDEDLEALSAFKMEQEQQSAKPIEPAKLVERLSAKQIQQWMIEINNQWLLRGDAQQSEAQLIALEQAVAISDLPNISEVARTIGQNLSDVKAYSAQGISTQERLTNGLESLIVQMNAIPQPDLKRSKTADNRVASGEEQEAAGPSKVNTLLDKFSGLVNVKKRETETELSSLEGLLLHDVLLQRLELLIDRVNWAANIESQTELNSALAKVGEFVHLHFKARSQHFAEPLALLESIEFSQRKPLTVLSLSAE